MGTYQRGISNRRIKEKKANRFLFSYEEHRPHRMEPRASGDD